MMEPTRRQLFKLIGAGGMAALLPRSPPAVDSFVLIVSPRRLVTILAAGGPWKAGAWRNFKAMCMPGLKLVSDPYAPDRLWVAMNESDGSINVGEWT